MGLAVLVVRDPDGDNTVSVYLDGRKVNMQTVDIWEVDPGRGYTAEDWVENVAWAYKSLPECQLRDDYLAWLEDPPGSKYIDGWAERKEELLAEVAEEVAVVDGEWEVAVVSPREVAVDGGEGR